MRRDYILKLLQDAFAAIAALLGREGNETERQREVESLYLLFGSDKDFFRQADEDEMLSSVVRMLAQGAAMDEGSVDPAQLQRALELLAALMYADFSVSELSEGLRRDVALRSCLLYLRVQETSETFSQERIDRIEELKEYLDSFA